MIRLDPLLEVSHWRPGITYFYLQEYDKAARQFEICHNYDEVDRENGIWHFMSQYKREGLKAVRDGLLIYEKDIFHPIHCFIKCLQVAKILIRYFRKSRRLIILSIIESGFFFMQPFMLVSILHWLNKIKEWSRNFFDKLLRMNRGV